MTLKKVAAPYAFIDTAKECGLSTADVYGRLRNTEEVIPLFKYPWIVAFFRNGEIICTGTLVSQQFVLTAAECVLKTGSEKDKKCQRSILPQDCFYTPEEISIKLVGDRFLEKPVKIKFIKPHSKFNNARKTNNIAFVELEQPLKCSPMTSPICLPFNTKELKFDNKLTIAGWGSHAMNGYYEYYQDEYQTLREGDIVKIDTSKCNNSRELNSQYLCAFGKGQSVCHGDVGGSAFARSGKNYYAIGMVSHSNEPRFRPSLPVTLINFNHFAGWIRHFVRKFPEPWSK
ncbi:enteropeptidase [Trichonephila clavata]|uniref:Enteropeptidase n=1 Tax=Trichonephila clavata TaxID=2740835 RepID=A0A8X6F0J7_TRICU|nr:enteropeptidase [Trichonephila clavata]